MLTPSVAMRCSQDCRLLASIHENGMLRLWDLPTRRWGSTVWEAQCGEAPSQSALPACMRWLRSLRRAAALDLLAFT